MSHLTFAQIDIVIPEVHEARSILEKALEAIAKEIGATLVKNAPVMDFYGRKVQCDYVLRLRGAGSANGIGVQIKNGKVTLIGDAWAFNYRFGQNFEKLQEKILQYYTAIAVATVAQTMGMKVSNVVQTEEAIVIDLAR